MIYSDDFIWLHFPKCAGSKVEELFSKYFSDEKTIFQDPIGPTYNYWHDSIEQREKRDTTFTLGNRTIISSFRRLPTWLQSRYNFEVRRNPGLDHRPEKLLEGKFLEANGVENHADYYPRKYLPKHILLSPELRFLRLEYFEADFKEIFGTFVAVDKIPSWEFQAKANTSRSVLPKTIKEALSRNQEVLYARCPYWKMVEEIAYP